MTGQPLRVLQVVQGWPPQDLGGTELYVRSLHEGLRGHGVASRVFAGAENSVSPLRRWDDGAVCQVATPLPRSFVETYSDPLVEEEFRSWFLRFRPHVVHVHHLARLSMGIPALARRLGAVVLFTLHDYWLPCARGQLVGIDLQRCPGPGATRCTACLAAGRAPRRRAHGAAPPPLTHRARLLGALGRLAALARPGPVQDRMAAVAALTAEVSMFLSPSRHLARRVVELGLASPQRVRHVPLPLVNPVVPAPPSQGPVRFLFLGSLIPTKGPHLLLEAFSRLPRGAASLTMAGPAPRLDLDPDYPSRLARRASEVSGVRILPPVSPSDVQALLSSSDVMVLPSIWEENSPLVLREAMAAGLRVVASRRGGMVELAPRARLVEPEEPGALERALAVEVHLGRLKLPPASWEDATSHAGRLMELYLSCRRSS